MVAKKAVKPVKKVVKRAAPPRPSSGTMAVSRVLNGVPTAAQVAAAIAAGEKLYVDEETGEGVSIIPALIANASKPEDLFGGSELEQVKNHLGETLRVLGINNVNNSDFEDGLGIYIVCTVVNNNGETFALGVGAADAVAKICALNDMGAFPYDVAFVEADKKTKRGFTPINLESRQVDLF